MIRCLQASFQRTFDRPPGIQTQSLTLIRFPEEDGISYVHPEDISDEPSPGHHSSEISDQKWHIRTGRLRGVWGTAGVWIGDFVDEEGLEKGIKIAGGCVETEFWGFGSSDEWEINFCKHVKVRMWIG
jgi:hypothetical protein